MGKKGLALDDAEDLFLACGCALGVPGAGHWATDAEFTARLRAVQGRWTEFAAIVDGRLAALHYRSVHLPHLALRRPDDGLFARLAAVFVGVGLATTLTLLVHPVGLSAGLLAVLFIAVTPARRA